MNDLELKRAMEAYLADVEPSRDALARFHERASETPARRLPSTTVRALLAGVVAVSLSAVGVSLLKSSSVQSDGSLVNPVSTIETPFESVSPTPSPVQSTVPPSPTSGDAPGINRFVLPGGEWEWEFQYPSDWTVEVSYSSENPGQIIGGYVRSPRLNQYEFDLPINGEFKIDLLIYPRGTFEEDAESRDIDTLKAHWCDPNRTASAGSSKILDCRTVDINGRTWVWVHSESTSGEGKGFRGFLVVAVVDDRLFLANGGGAPGDKQEAGLRQIAEIFKTFIIRSFIIR